MRLLILYGSQTGTAQDVAEQLWRSSKRWGFTGPVLAMDEYPVQQLVREKLVVFVVATTGDGEEPENMRHSWRFLLRRNLPANSLQHLEYACLGLGDSGYAKFNFAAKKLNKRLQQLGGTPILPIGLCDDQHDLGLNAVALVWMEQLWQELNSRFSLTKVNDEGNESAVFKWGCRVEELANGEILDDTHLLWPHKGTSSRFTLKLNQRTTSGNHFQDVRLLQFDFPNGTIWSPGDILQLHPRNSEVQVERFFQLIEEHQLGFNADTIVQLHSNYEDMPLPKYLENKLSVRQLATYVWDLSAKPRQRAFELLALNCEDELEKEKLVEFTTVEGLDDVIQYVNRPRRTILEVLYDFRHATSKLTLNLFMELFSFIQPRSFSIASAVTSGTLDLLVAVVEYKTKLSEPRLGLCSNWLKSLRPGSEVVGVIKRGTMKLSKDLLSPLIMVGPGSGIAPFRSIIQSREYARDAGAEVGSLVVFFGCRNKDSDFHFREDFLRWESKKLVKSFVAFSRDQPEKVYVQHLIEQNQEFLNDLIRNQEAVILVAGSSKNMPKAVKEAFVRVLGGDALYIEQMIKVKRYQEETWS